MLKCTDPETGKYLRLLNYCLEHLPQEKALHYTRHLESCSYCAAEAKAARELPPILSLAAKFGLAFVLLYLITALPHFCGLIRQGADSSFPRLWQHLSAFATIFSPGGATYWALHAVIHDTIMGMKTSHLLLWSLISYFILGYLYGKYIDARRG